jgi:hypothetical protein
MIRFILFMATLLVLAYFGATVKLGNRTLFGHVRAVWATDEAQDMKKGVEQSAKPMLEKVKRGVEAGYREATRDEAPGVNQPAERDDGPAEKPQVEKQPAEVEKVDAGVGKPKRHRRQH